MTKLKNAGNSRLVFLKIFLFISPFFVGGGNIAASAVFSAALGIYLIIDTVKNKNIKKDVNITLLALLMLPVAYLIVSIWAVDTGTAVFGFVKFLPVALFALCVSPLGNAARTELLDVIPGSALVSGIISYALSFIPGLDHYILVADRLGGTFQYPNTFALYCLAGIAVLLLKDELTYKNWIASALLTALILLSGSRTVFIFLIVLLIIVFIKLSGKNRIKLLITCAVVAAAGAIVIIATGSVQTVGRFLTISLESSTLNGRLLYYKDALHEILTHPFGLGYYGYYYKQPSFQTGVYSVLYVHSEPLQFLLDIGWIPAVCLFVIAGFSFFSKKTSFLQKVLLFLIVGHSCFDFDLQFMSVMFILILTLDFDIKHLEEIKIKNPVVPSVLISVLIVASFYFGTADTLYVLKKYEAEEKIYGADTRTEVMLMTDQDNYEDINKYADRIIARNGYVSIAYSAKANRALENGDIKSFTEYKEKAILCSPYSLSEYEDYIGKLLYAVEIYTKAGDLASADYCNSRILYAASILEQTEEKTSPVAWKIQDIPDFSLPDEYVKYIEHIKDIDR